MKGFDVSNLNFKSFKLSSNSSQKERSKKFLEHKKMNKSFNLESEPKLDDSYTHFKNDNNIPNERIKGKSYSQNNLDISKSNYSNFTFKKNLQENDFYEKITPFKKLDFSQNKIQNNEEEKQDDNDLHSCRIIIKNLNNELREKNDEIKILKKNFKEKLSLIENENRINSDLIEKYYNIQMSNFENNYNNLLKTLEIQRTEKENIFEIIINNLITDLKLYKRESILKFESDEKIDKFNLYWMDNHKKMKLSYENKIQDFLQNLQDPIYNFCLQKIQYYNKHKEHFKKIVDLNFEDNNNNKINLNSDEIDSYLDCLKLKYLKIEAIYVKGINDIKLKYQDISTDHNSKKRNRYDSLKEFVEKKFTEIDNLNTFVEDDERENIFQNLCSPEKINYIDKNNIISGIGTKIRIKKGNFIN